MSPDNQNAGWQAGYEPSFENIGCFSHIHEWTLGGLGIMAANGELKTRVGDEQKPDEGYRSRIDKRTERADIGYKYLSSIERGFSIPSTEVIMRLAKALDTTPDAFLVGSSKSPGEEWKAVADKLRPLDARQLDLAGSFIDWVTDHKV